ncbi:MAG: TIGR03842 family LLM class F420-dependent oxidoreductase [Acidimicrobiia bacterium]|nr:TIGR03842 family LLM class F420-dependent oxidoreductase [Acidimicrobiia bacterium]NNF88457.1 TIGR03842 family LLM class F420-dependent oxidoreductase [Acidimicrobiia bacterium]NNJ47214.1 TIGR03842 family LLM class F420-dependent oxidoreductase [Acidimicrobiia bacterium]NNL12847.1 TIGR03842 family LLM class F420-dependent oxidoreductase [Acidimicrobiia bacterium]RZV44455.1 MAG: TIGR03842 family LLM class F420-dependent oxidoreductase [Acidimicrobiia bacterium]
MEFGVVLQTNPPAREVVRLASLAEDMGFSYGWTFDSHILWQEPFVIFTLMLEGTTNMKVGPMVTNPGTRDWTVLASLFATLDEMFEDRMVCGMGRGDSALRFIGRKPSTLAETEEAIGVIKGLVAGEEVDYNGEKLQITWVREGHDLPVWMAGYGPRALTLTGRIADGFILQLADPYLVEWTSKFVRSAAEAAGRDPSEVQVCAAAPAYVGDNLDHQRDQVRWFGGMVGNHVADLVERYGEDPEKVPTVLSDYIKERQDYDYRHHGTVGNPSTDFVPDDVVDRFCVLGPPEAHIERIRELEAAGVDQFCVYLMHDQQEETLHHYGETIIPAFH